MNSAPSPVLPECRECKHCGTRFKAGKPEDIFCCGGCTFVHNLILQNGLDQFYVLKGSSPVPPVKSAALLRRDYGWLRELAERRPAGAAGRAESYEFAVQGISCTGCVWLIERILQGQPGVLCARGRAHPGRLNLDCVSGQCDLVQLAEELRQFGYLLGPLGEEERRETGFPGRMGLCGAFAMNAMAFSLPRYLGMESGFELAGIFTLVAGLSATLAVVTGGSYFIGRAVKCLQCGVLHMDLPIALGIVSAYAGSLTGWMTGVESLQYFDFVAVFTFLMLAGRKLQLAGVERNRGRLLRLMGETGTLRNADGEKIGCDALRPGKRYLVESGQIIPVASRLLSNCATFSMESISGEPEPRVFSAGNRVASGSLNVGSLPVELEAIEAWQDSLYRKLRERSEGPGNHPFLDRVLKYAIAAVLILATGGFLAWWAATGDVARALQVTISVLVVSCPCALGVAIPFADDLSAGCLERMGVFVRRPDFWPRLRRVRHVIFDKTGTLTLETPVLENPEALTALKAEPRNALAVLVFDSLHPVSRALTEALASSGVTGPSARTAVEETPGQGLAFTDKQGARWSLGRAGWASPRTSGDSTVFACDGVAVAQFRFRDSLRPDAVEAIRDLAARHLTLHLLSGDQPDKVHSIARRVGIPESRVFGAQTPYEKEAKVREIDHRDSLYIGDGLNDSLAFSAACCTGTPVVDKGMLESKADFYFLSRSLAFAGQLFRISDLRTRAVRCVAAFAIAYNVLAAGVSLAGVMSPLVAAVIMPLSGICTLAVVWAHFKKICIHGEVPGRTR
ncbi:MAG TPA: heavy metal translocating P-type ATPase metal-binding domain-containing protein [Verrucomicrobiales bacterium]|nr:heavy metal translocating P-type ATPase metal-binding domain-containing protein [Verrucomicrobiales bacterium]